MVGLTKIDMLDVAAKLFDNTDIREITKEAAGNIKVNPELQNQISEAIAECIEKLIPSLVIAIVDSNNQKLSLDMTSTKNH